jgi:hypothetical protein
MRPMKKVLSVLLLIALTLSSKAQETVKIKVAGISDQVAQQLSANQDRVSWYSSGTSNVIATNLIVSLKNTDQKSSDKGRFGLKADPGADGKYAISAEVEVKLKKVDKTKPIAYEITLETILGNEIFAVGTINADALDKPILLDKYMWRASNEKIAPERKLCIAFTAYIEDTNERALYSETEGDLKFERSAFELYLKQDENSEWRKYTESSQGSLNNGNALAMTSPLPDWINTSKPLSVRFSAKTGKGNFVWGEYRVNPNEYRKEARASHYTTVAFDPSTAVKKGAVTNSAPATNSTPVAAEALPIKRGNEALVIPAQSAPSYKDVIIEADKLFTEGQFQAAKDKYTKAAELSPMEEYPKKRIEECNTKLTSVKSLKSAGLKDKMK